MQLRRNIGSLVFAASEVHAEKLESLSGYWCLHLTVQALERETSPVAQKRLNTPTYAHDQGLVSSYFSLTDSLEKETWGSLSLPSRFKPDLGLFRTFGVDLSTSPGCDCSHASPCVGPVGIEPTFTKCKPSGFNR